MSIKRNLQRIQEQLGDISLLVISKNISNSDLLKVYDLGYRDFGESRVKEALEKKSQMPSDCRWHLIGHLQKNKVHKAVGQFALIHSVDSLELASKLSESSLNKGLITSVLLQVNISKELTKGGFKPEEIPSFFPQLIDLKGIKIKGMMTMAPLTEDQECIRLCFRKLKELKESLHNEELTILSMGMSSDYLIAIEEGATLVRLGNAIFMER